MFLGWFAVTGSERRGHGFNGGIAGFVGLAGFLSIFGAFCISHRKTPVESRPKCRARCAVNPRPLPKVKGPILTSKSTTLGWGTLMFHLLFDRL